LEGALNFRVEAATDRPPPQRGRSQQRGTGAVDRPADLRL